MKQEKKPEELEGEAISEVLGYQKAMERRAMEAFPDEKDAIRLSMEGLAHGGAAFVSALGKITRAAEMRLRSLLTDATATAEAQRQASIANAAADTAAAKRDILETIHAGFKAVASQEAKTRYVQSISVACVTAAFVFISGSAAGWMAHSYFQTRTAIAELEALRRETANARQEATNSRETVRMLGDVVKDIQPALTVMTSLNRMEPEPRASMIALLQMVADRKAANVYQWTTLTDKQRSDAMQFARISDDELRQNMLGIAQLANARSSGWWEGERVPRGCLTYGPNLATATRTTLNTCLVELPDAVPKGNDSYLRRRHYGLTGP